jgi:hypothetical protein
VVEGLRSNPMPRYYLHFRKGDLLAKDDEGQDFPGLEEAKAAGAVAGRQIVAENVEFNAANPLTSVIVADESGTEVASIPAKDLLPEPLK